MGTLNLWRVYKFDGNNLAQTREGQKEYLNFFANVITGNWF